MQNEQEISPKELKKQVKILVRENKVFEKKLLVSEERNLSLEEQKTSLEEQKSSLEEKNKFLEFQLAQMKRMLFGVKRERFISNIIVGQLTLPFEGIEVSWSSSTGQLFDKVKLMMLFKPGLAGKVILKFSGDPSKEVSRINFGNNFDSVPKDKVCLCC